MESEVNQKPKTEAPHGPIDVDIHVPPDVCEDALSGYREAVEDGYPGEFAQYLIEHATIRSENVRLDAVAPTLKPVDR